MAEARAIEIKCEYEECNIGTLLRKQPEVGKHQGRSIVPLWKEKGTT